MSVHWALSFDKKEEFLVCFYLPVLPLSISGYILFGTEELKLQLMPKASENPRRD
jgi:hypothetical protein